MFISLQINLIHQHWLQSVKARSKIIIHYRLVLSQISDPRTARFGDRLVLDFANFFGPGPISFGPWTSAPGVKRLSNSHFIILFQIIDLNKSPPFEINSDVPSLPIKIVNQLENDTILIGYSRYVKIISKSGKLKPARKLRSEIGFDFDIEAAVCLPDSVLGFHKHGLQGRSYKDESITQELNDPNKSFKLLCGIGKYDVTMTSSRGIFFRRV